MATTKRVKTTGHLNKSYGGMGISAIILSLILSIVFLASMFARPVIQLSDGRVLYLDGIIASAVLLGSMMWALIELVTPPGKGITLIWRAGLGLIIGGAIGAYVGYSFSFAQYVILPIYQHDNYALFYFLTILIFGLAVIWAAAWDHRHGFLGQLGRHMHKSNFKESGRHKGWRAAVALLIAIVFVFLMIPASSALGSAMVSLDDHNAAPLALKTITDKNASSAVTNELSRFNFVEINGHEYTCFITSVSETTSGYMPTYQEKNATGVEKTYYSTSAVFEYNLTVGQAVNRTIHSMYFIFCDRANYSLTLGTGNWTTFSPLEIDTMNDTTNVTLQTCTASGKTTKPYEAFRFGLTPAVLFGNRSQTLSVKIQELSKTPADELKIVSMTIGVQHSTLIGPIQVDQVGYIIGGFFTLVASILVTPWYDLGAESNTMPSAGKKRSGRR